MNDYIKREDAIEMLPTEFNGIEIGRAISVADEFLKEHECDELWDAVRALRDWVECVTDEIKKYLPSADVVEHKSGEWIESKEAEFPFADCSACGYRVGMFQWNFCPNCGADMRGKDNENG